MTFARRLGTPHYTEARRLTLPQNDSREYPCVYRGTVNTSPKHDIYTCGVVVIVRFGPRAYDAWLCAAGSNLAALDLPTPVCIRVTQLLRAL